MFRVILLLLFVIPVIEVWLFVTSGRAFGWPVTLLLIILTGVIGAVLAKRQGLEVWRLAQIQLRQGEIPGEAILDGIGIFAGGILLLTPGFFTDFTGFLLLIPFTRGLFKIWIKKKLWKNIQEGKFNLYFKKW